MSLFSTHSIQKFIITYVLFFFFLTIHVTDQTHLDVPNCTHVTKRLVRLVSPTSVSAFCSCLCDFWTSVYVHLMCVIVLGNPIRYNCAGVLENGQKWPQRIEFWALPIAYFRKTRMYFPRNLLLFLAACTGASTYRTLRKYWNSKQMHIDPFENIGTERSVLLLMLYTEDAWGWGQNTNTKWI